MALAPGSKLGPYEILAPIGAGGMGEVYRAHDARMGRDVAIKISAERFGDRFSREVRAVAALNHPNICHLYDVGPDYLVMELVEGPTLAERIKQGAVPLDEALGIAKQVAEALEAANAVKNRQLVAAANSNAVYVPPGYLLFAREHTLMAQPFDAAKARTAGDAIPIAEQIDSAGDFTSQYQFSVSQNGVLAYTSGGGFEGLRLTWVDRSGKMTGAVGPPGVYSNFRLSPDEKRITFDRPDAQTGVQDVWVMDLVRGTTSRLTFDPAVDNLPIWSPDGLRILYPNRRSGVFDLYIKAASGAGQEEVLVKMGTNTGWGTHWSRDGRFIMYEMPGANTGEDLWVAPQFGDRKPFPYLQSQFNESEGNFSRDGRWVAYVSNESGRNEIYVQAFPLSGAKFQISTGGGTEPGWRRDGAELFYLAADRNLMAVPVKSGATLEAGVPKPLFPIAVTPQKHSYAAANDGQRFLVAAGQGDKSVPVDIVLNWQAGLKK